MAFPESIQSLIGDRDFIVDKIGMSDSQVICFEDMVLKIEKDGEESKNEYNMMSWLQQKIPVPKILYYEKAADANYLLMSKLDGEMICCDYYLSHPQELIKIIAKGLRNLWSVNISDCPYNNSVDNKLRQAEIRVHSGLCSMEDCEPSVYGENGFKSPKELLEWLKANKPPEKPALSHGDFCLPNIFAKNGEISGYIDLGGCGIADKYQDIALCCRSLKHNLEGKYAGNTFSKFNFEIEMLFDELQVKPNWKLINYYILLDELF